MRELLWRTAVGLVLCLGVGESYCRMPQEIPLPPSPPVDAPFIDLDFGERWYDGAQYGYRKGLIRGMTETEFGGELPATRAMAATMVWRMAGQPQVLGRSRFADVEPDRYYTVAVVWGESRGLWEGYGDSTFRPDAEMTWGQLELVLARYYREGRLVGAAIGYPLSAGPGRGKEGPGGMTRGELAEALMELCEEQKSLREKGTLSLP